MNDGESYRGKNNNNNNNNKMIARRILPAVTN
jgi:hypothetical protein